MKKSNQKTKREMEKIYESHLGWMNAGRKLKMSFLESLKENPKITLLLKLVIMANIGIWILVFFKVYENVAF
jgi:zona occludens toxin (predicted ATPase)